MSSGWWDEAACLGADTEIFYPSGTGPDQYAEALSYCSRCPVTAECEQYALDKPEPFGTWGGLTQAEREGRIRKDTLMAKWANGHGDMQGTTSGYYRHRTAGEKPCDPCRKAYNEGKRTKAALQGEQKCVSA